MMIANETKRQRITTRSAAGVGAAAVWLAIVVLTNGCVNVSKEFAAKRYYALDATRGETAPANATGPVLAVRPFRASPRYEGNELVSRLSDVAYRSDFYSEFLVEPAALVTEQTRRWLADSGLFQCVVEGSGSAALTHVLEGAVTVIQGDYRDRAAPQAVLEAQFFLVEAAAASRIAFHKTYRRERPLADTTPDELVRGWNQALQETLTALEEDLRQALSAAR